jgi:hypothetical protein
LSVLRSGSRKSTRSALAGAAGLLEVVVRRQHVAFVGLHAHARFRADGQRAALDSRTLPVACASSVSWS